MELTQAQKNVYESAKQKAPHLAEYLEKDKQKTIKSIENTKTVNGINGRDLKIAIERIERLEEEKKAIAEDIKEIYNQAKSYGYDTKIIREVIKIRKLDQGTLFEKESLIEIYKRALGMI